MRARELLVPLVMAVGLIAGCGGDGSGGNGDQDDELAGEPLLRGEAVEADGAVLAFHPEADAESVEVAVRWREPADDPDFPLDDERISDVNGFLEIVATDTDEDWERVGRPFLVGIPVPEDFDDGHLYPLQLAHGDFVVHDAGPGHDHEAIPGDMWISRVGVYDARYRMYFVSLMGIGGPEYPTRIAMTEHVEAQAHDQADFVDDQLQPHFPGLNLEPREVSGQPLTGDSRVSRPSRYTRSHTSGHDVGFDVRCELAPPDDCDDEGVALAAIEQALHDALPVYQQMEESGKPLLSQHALTVLNPWLSHYIYHLRNEEADEACEATTEDATRGGVYISSGFAATCMPAVEAGRERTRLTTAHELFHAMQYGYGTRSAGRHGFVTEGTARLAEDAESPDELSGNEDLLRVDAELTDQRDYRGEYFFEHVLDAADLDFRALGDIFSRGLSMFHVDAFIQDRTPFDDLGSAYWDWAKHQAFESRKDWWQFDNPEPCSLHPDAADPDEIHYDPASPPSAAKSFTLDPLTSKVIRVDFNALAGDDYAVDMEVGASSDAIQAKFYDDAWRGGPVCRGQPDADEYRVSVPAGSSQAVYALVSNTSQDASNTATFRFPGSLKIVEPQAGANLLEGETDLRAVAGLPGVDAEAVEIEWGYENMQGTFFSLGTTASGETLSQVFCDGEYTVHAEASDPEAEITASDEVTFEVEDLGATDPPPGCSVTADIIEPDDGAVFAPDETVTFRAVVDDSRPDSHPESHEPRYPIHWHLGGAGGSLLAQDELEFSRDDLDIGEHTIHVEYGAAEDEISIEVVDTQTEPPEVSITEPQDGTEFDVDSDEFDGSTGWQIELAGTGTDAQDGSLSGGDLVWHRRETGSTTWHVVGTGTSTILEVDIDGGDPVKHWEIRLDGENSDGLTDTHEITITTSSPGLF